MFDSYFTKSELKVPGRKYQIESILELDNLGTKGMDGHLSRKLIGKFLGGI